MNQNYMKQYELWLDKAVEDKEVAEELRSMEGSQETIESAFYKNLEFGTGGLRGVIGAGTNRMNIYTVAKASQGLANYVCKKFPKGLRKIAVSYDSRIKSELFAKTASSVFAANGIQVYLYSQLMPTPCLSFAVRYLGCQAGVMVTASHNPSKYNGYKVYGPDGCQITTEAAQEVLSEIEALDVFQDIKKSDFHREVSEGTISYISEEVFTAFTEEVKKQTLILPDTKMDRDVSICYTPLNGTGLKPVLRVLRESGFTNITVVKEQEKPDGTFPTCPYPNPEIREAMALGMEYAQKYQADLLLATDPDCDRVGIEVKIYQGVYVCLSGNETGMLLLDYLCSRRQAMGTMPEKPIMVKTIATTDMAERIADHYGVRTIQVLTGFKFIGEQIGLLEKEGKEDSYVFGFEESYGYLSGTYVRDKDAVNGAFLICEMFAYYKTRGVSLYEKLEQLYQTYGYCLNTLHSYEFEGVSGFEKMQEIMKGFRGEMASVGGKHVVECQDYLKGLNGLPKSNVLKFLLEGDCSVIIRPSGTEPKLKMYVSVRAEDREEAEREEERLTRELECHFQ